MLVAAPVHTTTNATGKVLRGSISDATEKLAQLSVGSGKVVPTTRQQAAAAAALAPPPMKAGGWHGHGHTDTFLGRTHGIPSGRSHTRKVVG